jgi:hypothetical protein
MPRGTKRSNVDRAQVVAALLTGQGVREVSRALDVPVATVSRIKNDLAKPIAAKALKGTGDVDPTAPVLPDEAENFQADVEAGLRGDDDLDDDDDDLDDIEPSHYLDDRFGLEQVGTQKKERSLEQLIHGYLNAGLETLAIQAVVARNPRYLMRFSPESMAVLHGVIADKMIRILEFAEAAKPVE